MRYKHTDEEFCNAVKNSISLRQVLIKLNIVDAGGNYSTTKNRIHKLNLDTSHFTGQLWSKGIILGPVRPLKDYLTNKAKINSHKLRQRLFKEGIFERKCMNCKNTLWLGEPIPLELHHIDGNHDNNRKENLQILCPNCHSKTNTFRKRK